MPETSHALLLHPPISGLVVLDIDVRHGGDANVQVNEQMAAHGRSWPAAWLRARGLEAAAESWMRYSEGGGNRP
jgi:hypothetical protein